MRDIASISDSDFYMTPISMYRVYGPQSCNIRSNWGWCGSLGQVGETSRISLIWGKNETSGESILKQT